MNLNIEKILENSAEQLSVNSFLRKNSYPLPSKTIVNEFVTLVWEAIFPGYHGNSSISTATLKSRISIKLEKAYNILIEQIDCALRFENIDCTLYSQEIASEFIEQVPHIKQMLITDVEAMYKADPAATSMGEVIFSYPSIVVMVHHRIAHLLYKLQVPIIPRMIAELAHSKTGIDIHPGATIGEYFAIDHGTGVVIGATSIIGRNVVIYQGVTLGAKAFHRDEDGNLCDEPRHPIVEDNVVIYANATVLGRITIGTGTIIGSNTWTLKDVAPNSKITQAKLK